MVIDFRLGLKWCQDTEHNNTQHKGLVCDTQHKQHSTQQCSAIMLSVTMLSVAFAYYYAECYYTECRCLVSWCM
jgi:hypothetical protein